MLFFPDKGEFTDWNKKAQELQGLGFNINCSSYVENSNLEIGADLADIYFANKEVKETPIVDEIKYTKTEQIVHDLAKNYPSLLTLINTFDLIDDIR